MKIRLLNKTYLLLTLLLALGFSMQSQGQNLKLSTKIVASDRDKDDWFSYNSVDISGNYAISGAYVEKHNAAGGAELTGAGSAYIFEKENGVWSQKQKLVANDRAVNNRFGHSTSMSGNVVAISATGSSSGLGAVYIFERGDNGVWSQKHKIVGLVAGGYSFGEKIKLKENRLFIADRNNKTNATGGAAVDGAGAIFVFERQPNGSWTQQQKIVAGDRSVNAYFGEVFDVDGDRLVVGKEKETKDLQGANEFVNAGAVYVFERGNDAKWTQKVKLIGPAADRTTQLYFGRKLALKDNTLVITAIGGKSDDGAPYLHYAGICYIYQRDANGVWNYHSRIFADDREAQEYFGEALAFDGTHLVVGARSEGDAGSMGGFPFPGAAKSYGAAYFFAKNAEGKYIQKQKIVATTRTELQMFGADLAMDGTNVIVGCYRDDTDANGLNSKAIAGSAYLYDIEIPAPAIDHTNAFITTWDTDKLSTAHVSFNTTGSNYEYYWEKIGDEENTNSGTYMVNTNAQSLVLPQFAHGTGAYKLYIKPGNGTFSAFNTYGFANEAKGLTAVQSWGNTVWTNMKYAFVGAENINSLPADAPNLAAVTDMSWMFAGASSFNQSINHWDVSKVTDMSNMFVSASAFNQNLGSWNLSSVVTMQNMLNGSKLSSTNYGLTLKGWAEGANTPNNIILGAVGLTYPANSIQHRNVLTNNKNWTIDDSGVLPVSIASFNASLAVSDIRLIWQTASERNNKEFILSRSADGVTFNELTRIKGAGNSNENKDYFYTDRNPLNGTNYYQLAQLDTDGQLNIVGNEVVNFKLSSSSVKIFPNPTAREINVSIPSEFGKTADVSILDITGKTLHAEKLTLLQGLANHKLNNTQLPAGTYIIKIKGEQKTESLKVLVK
ncbi:MAG: BspA family leucine-rich repeat surface protein [Pedobacter sp.]|uniref:BspA family leucine-rich repeat surface protein n=1 Tax=Pedobacter sp. TaxID=1411316 RepID=UPI002808710F|nr:BspA family leucine-rich repeat surface protein [Pedobacter sp.]MDQ8003753.1 BspA family leucine-rich repeat surface protein [Pedobacter sp.]